MKTRNLNYFLYVAIALAAALAARAADRIELTDGSVVYGKIVSAEAGFFKVETTFAAAIVIKQDQIKSFTTDEAVNVQLGTGSTALGQVRAGDAGIVVAASAGQLTATPAQVTAVWRVGADSPETRRREGRPHLGLRGRARDQWPHGRQRKIRRRALAQGHP
jgi:hypothetical protein